MLRSVKQTVVSPQKVRQTFERGEYVSIQRLSNKKKFVIRQCPAL